MFSRSNRNEFIGAIFMLPFILRLLWQIAEIFLWYIGQLIRVIIVCLILVIKAFVRHPQEKALWITLASNLVTWPIALLITHNLTITRGPAPIATIPAFLSTLALPVVSFIVLKRAQEPGMIQPLPGKGRKLSDLLQNPWKQDI